MRMRYQQQITLSYAWKISFHIIVFVRVVFSMHLSWLSHDNNDVSVITAAGPVIMTSW